MVDKAECDSDMSAIARTLAKGEIQDTPETSISRVTPEDLPALAESELLSFSGTDSSQALARRLHPFRANLVRSRISVSRWPDFPSTLKRYTSLLQDERNIVVKAVARRRRDDESRTDKHAPIGMAWLRLPALAGPEGKGRAKTVRNLTRRYASSVRERLKNLPFEAEADGTDFALMETFKTEVLRVRKIVEGQILRNRPYAALEIVFVHPRYRGSGAGAALLSHCADIAESYRVGGADPGLPILLESTGAATPLYLRFGFREVYRSRIRYGGDVYEWPVMLREPEGKTKKTRS